MTHDDLWQSYLDLGDVPHAYLAGALAEYVITHDPERFAALMSEAKAVAR